MLILMSPPLLPCDMNFTENLFIFNGNVKVENMVSENTIPKGNIEKQCKPSHVRTHEVKPIPYIHKASQVGSIYEHEGQGCLLTSGTFLKGIISIALKGDLVEVRKNSIFFFCFFFFFTLFLMGAGRGDEKTMQN